MNKIFTVLALIISLNSFAQKDTALTYTEIISVESARQNDLFSNARMWADNNFKNLKAVISISDKESGELTGKGVMDLMIYYMRKKHYHVPVSIKFQFNIRVKDGKYKYEFKNFDIIHFWENDRGYGIIRSVQGNQSFAKQNKWNESAYDQIKEQVDARMNLLITSLGNDMNKSNSF